VFILYSKVHTGKHLSDACPIHNGLQQGENLITSALELSFRRMAQENQKGWEMNITHQLLVHAGDVNILGKKKKT
jgi:hypothetical protein